METKTILLLGSIGAVVVVAIALIASSAKRLESTEGNAKTDMHGCTCNVSTDVNIIRFANSKSNINKTIA